MKKSVLIADYKRIGKLPTVDALLDWRTRLVELKKRNTFFPHEWYDIEIEATDKLLNLTIIKK